MVGAVIYVRVSTKEQTENLSLPTQLCACEEYCRHQGYEVLERFHEEGESAKSADRSQLQNLLTFCRLNKGRVHFVVVFNLTRFARDKYDHFELRSHGNRFVGTGATAPAFSYLRGIETGNEGLVDQNGASWNRTVGWLRQLGALETSLAR